MKIGNETLYRTLKLDREHMNTDDRTIPASLSSEVEVQRFFGKEVLVHSKDAIDLDRAGAGLPLLFNHDRDKPIGVIEGIRLDGDRLRGMLRFSENSNANEIWPDVERGFLKDISIGYQVKKFEESDDSDVVRITEWNLLEASVVTVPADSTVGINRSKPTEDHKMKDPKTPEGGDNKVVEPTNVASLDAARTRARAEGLVEGQALALARIDEIETVFSNYNEPEHQELKRACIANGLSVDKSRAELLELLGTGGAPTGTGQPQSQDGTTRIVPGVDSIDKFGEAMTDALVIRSGAAQVDKQKALQESMRKNPFSSMPVSEMARSYLHLINVDSRGMSRSDLVGAALTRGVIGHGTSDFSNLLANVANKALLAGYDEAPETWQEWCRVGSIPDFKATDRAGLSNFSDLDEVKEQGEITHGTLSDVKESLTLVTWAKLFGISRQALINDDLQALGAIPRKMGRAAARKIGDLCYNILIDNAALDQDAVALFSVATHANLITSGAAPSVSTLDVLRTAMAVQTDPGGNGTLGIPIKYLLCPIALQTTSETLVAATYDPAGTAGTLKPNPFQNRVKVIADARLDADSAVKWYVLADQNMFDTVEIAFLDGNQSPLLESKNGWTIDGVEYKVRIDAIAKALDFRGAQQNDGA